LGGGKIKVRQTKDEHAPSPVEPIRQHAPTFTVVGHWAEGMGS
jgi:hypothetical protein